VQLAAEAGDLFQKGRYQEVLGVLDKWPADVPPGAEEQNLRSRAQEALALLKSFEAALSSKEYDGSLGIVGRLEKANPADPNISELRKRAESGKAASKATITIYRLSDPANLTMDSQPLGSGGEVEGKIITAGIHKIEVKCSSGKQASWEHHFLDGQSLSFVYDSSTCDFRPVTANDREVISGRRQREEVHTFPVEHLHGFLKGKCAGELWVSGLKLEYKPREGDHHFVIPFQILRLTLKEDRLEFVEKEGDKQYQFKARDAKQTAAIKKLWDNLQKLGR
jgi:hypothetical protein